MIYIVGSGPSGIACAYALVEKGLDVTILDAGIEIEPERENALVTLRSIPTEQWTDERLHFMKDKLSPSFRGVPLKYAYGSDFPYRDAERFMSIEADQAEATPSLAKGGLSNVWGGAVLPYVDSDLNGWPISVRDLAPHYGAVSSFMPVSAYHDDLERMFPVFTAQRFGTLKLSDQSLRFLALLHAHRDSLQREGIHFGHSRLAVRANPSTDDKGCVYCGLCMYGCPYNLIYCTGSTLDSLLRQKRLRYIRDVVVERCEEIAGLVRIHCRTRETGEQLVFEGSRVYLACGVLSTTMILLRSLGAYDQSVRLRDSQYFLLPLLRYESVPVTDIQHSLCQLFLEICDRRTNEHTVHLQVYSYNELYLKAIENLLGVAFAPLKKFISREIGRVFILQGYLHSNDSVQIRVRLEKGKADSTSAERLRLEVEPNANTRKAIRRVVSKLFSARSLLRAIPLFPFLTIAKPGRGFHLGGAFPMRLKPGDFESDCLGRPTGFQRVHVVDSTIFPCIPATTITYSVMANAHRIASSYHET
jgi:choline dehydrogenase-like flavoprotein